ncbi:TPA: DUF4416 family protein, partial [bacterium]|nr:DUF4416 family protein [bacterium]
MGLSRQPSPVKLFLAVLSQEGAVPASVSQALGEMAGRIDFSCGPVEFGAFSSYYEDEMGQGLMKSYVTFEGLIPRENLSSIKVITNRLEEELKKGGLRTVNLDPGFNIFIKNGIIPNGVDLEAANYFTAQKFFADENIFLAPTSEGKYAVIKDAALNASGRIVNNLSGGSTLSVVSPAILRNQISDATGEFKTIADDEIWAGTVVLSASRNTIIPAGVTVTILP